MCSSGALDLGQELNSAAILEFQGNIGRFQVQIIKSP